MTKYPYVFPYAHSKSFLDFCESVHYDGNLFSLSLHCNSLLLWSGKLTAAATRGHLWPTAETNHKKQEKEVEDVAWNG